jgi:quercetin dioxygenase-like cupin family protein
MADQTFPEEHSSLGAVQGKEAASWDWPDELDALTAAPANHALLLENERVRVIQTVVPVAATTPVHTHRWPSIEYVLSGANFVRRDAEGNVRLDTRVAGSEPRPSDVMWSDPFPPHSVENVGGVELRVIMVEVKDPR